MDKFPFSIAAWEADTKDLTAAAAGAYLRLILHIYRHEKHLPGDPMVLRHIAACDELEWGDIWPQIQGCFHRNNDRLVQRHCQRWLTKHRANLKQARMSGSKGGAAKALKDKENARASQRVAIGSATNGLDSQEVTPIKGRTSTPKDREDTKKHAVSTPPPQPTEDKETSSGRHSEPHSSIRDSSESQSPIEGAPPKNQEAPPPPRRKPEITLPGDFKIGKKEIDHATKHGFDEAETKVILDSFRESALANDRRYRDWHAAFRTWISKERQFIDRDTKPRNTGHQPAI